MFSFLNDNIPVDFCCPQCSLRKKMLVWRENCQFNSGVCEDCWEKLYNDIENRIRERLDENQLICDNDRIKQFKNKLEKLTVKE